MNTNKTRTCLILGICLFFLFAIFTIAVMKFDVKEVGPNDVSVGFSSLNESFFGKFGQNELFHSISGVGGFIALALCAFFGLMGVLQLVKRKSLFKVDRDILALGVGYVIVFALNYSFDKLAICFRPILEDGKLEASYPSSHTLLALFVFLSAVLIVVKRVKVKKVAVAISSVLIALACITVVCRLLSGYHWITDVIGSVILSSSLLLMYAGIVARLEK